MALQRRLVLILHGKAATNERVRDAIAAARDLGHQLDAHITLQEGDAERFAQEAARAAARGEIDTIVAGGGDGTLNAVVAGALAAEPEPACSFALLPLGTANDFARTAGIPVNDPLAAIEIALHAEPQGMDVGKVVIDEATAPRHFANMLTAGFGPRVTSEADPDLKAALGGAAYLISALARIGEVTPWEGRITGEDFSWSGHFVALAAGNGRRAGGGIELCPQAWLDDGALDLTIVEAPRGDVLAGLLGSLPMTLGAETETVIRTRGARFQVEVEAPVPVSLDGEMLEARRLDLSVDPCRLRFHLGAAAA